MPIAIASDHHDIVRVYSRRPSARSRCRQGLGGAASAQAQGQRVCRDRHRGEDLRQASVGDPLELPRDPGQPDPRCWDVAQERQSAGDDDGEA